ncbi:MAG TPA: type I DNA topoisomerase [Deltaproteobacteria bacterium]|nr:type I DNA topoisomerase [Deltaproteobacteria bacterium]
MAKALVVVESPTKVRTLSSFLGKDYVIKATYGHIKDLPKSKMGVDVDHDFTPSFTVMKGKAKVVDELKKASKEADKIYIGSDPDREGEAIAFHVAEVIGKKHDIKRVLFHEITKKAVQEALKKPQELDLPKYDAQKARRILDRIVGYEISPLLWERVKYGLSAGRVQSVALKLISERQDEIDAFVPEEYWTIEGLFELKTGDLLKAKLERRGDEKLKIGSEEEARRVERDLAPTADGQPRACTIRKVEEKDRYNVPQPVFKTSTLQQEAVRKLRFSSKKTMMVAQKLYEGVDVGKGKTTGLITYMRTDSVRVSQEALTQVRKLIESQFGATYVPAKPNFFKNSKSAQDAHEAIRPTDVALTPEKAKTFLEKDLFLLYELIWKRFVASQMSRERVLVKTADIACGGYVFVARGSKVIFDGFSKVYETNGEKDEPEEQFLPDLAEGDAVLLKELSSEQRFTSPPSYYTEGSLIKALEAKGIGRPSTYATIVSTIQDRGYVGKDKGHFVVTPLGRTVNRLLTEYFPKVVDIDFTAKMEEKLDQIEENQKSWVSSLQDFYGVFQKELSSARDQMTNLKEQERETQIACDKCGLPMVLRWGRNGEYLVCTGRPECKNKKNAHVDKEGNVKVIEEESKGTCPKCGGNLYEKSGRFGRFIACSNYPDCNYTKPFSVGFACPESGCTGELVERLSKKRKRFYGCTRYPECSFATSFQPKEGPCPVCGSPVVFAGRGKNICLRKDCGWKSK